MSKVTEIAQLLCCPDGCAAEWEGPILRNDTRPTTCPAKLSACVYQHKAREILKLLYVPTEAMVSPYKGLYRTRISRHTAIDIWQGMIETALKEE